MLGAVPRQPFFRLEGLGLLQASKPGSTLVGSSWSSPIAGTAMTGVLGTASLAIALSWGCLIWRPWITSPGYQENCPLYVMHCQANAHTTCRSQTPSDIYRNTTA